MAERVITPVVRFVLTLVVATPIWLLVLGLSAKYVGALGNLLSTAVSLLAILLCWEAARWIRARALRRYDL